MMRIGFILFICMLALSSHAIDFKSNPRVKFERYSISDGLSHVGVSSFCQDEKGFLWIGTYDGLNRFDGINFKVFKNIPNDSTTLINNRVRCVLEHSSGKMFIGTEGGLCIYNPIDESFNEFKLEMSYDNDYQIMSLFEDSSKRLWVITNHFVAYVVDFERNSTRSFLLNSDSRVINGEVDILEDSNSNVWIVGAYGLFRFTKNLKLNNARLSPDISKYGLNEIEIGKDNSLWIGQRDKIKQARIIDSKEKGLSVETVQTIPLGYRISSFIIDSNENIWIGTLINGVVRLIMENNKLVRREQFVNSPQKETISSNWISSIYEDRTRNIWFATSERGINKYCPYKEVFLTFDKEQDLKGNYVLGIYEYKANYVLIGTRNSAISAYDANIDQLVEPNFDYSIIKNNSVQAFLKDSKNCLWVGADNSLYYLPPHLKSLKRFDSSFIKGDNNRVVTALEEDRFKHLWVGTRSGIYRLTIDSNFRITEILDFNERSDHILLSKVISRFYIDPKDQSLWLGTWYSGLFHISFTGEEKKVDDFEIRNYLFTPNNSMSLGNNFVTSIVRTNDRNLWVGTEGGGFGFLENGKEEEGNFINFTEAEGLSNNVVKSVLQDESGRLFIGTNFKLNVYNPSSNEFKYFDTKDGLKSEYFNRAGTIIEDGRMVFGGNQGITVVDPRQIGRTRTIPIPEFGSFQLSYKTVTPGEIVDDKVILEKALSYTDEIKLNFRQNTFSFGLVGLSFDDPEDNKFRYRLTDYDQEWIYSNPSNNMASYTNVPPGEYMFEFYAANNDGEWCENPKQISIVITPPFWKTPWAYALYVLVITGIIVAVFVILLNIERLKSNLRIEQLEKAKEKEINDVKLRFFTNISHEFKTPVSLILGPVELLVNKFKENDSIRRNLLMINEQANYLLRLLDQLLEFRKVESESLKLECAELDIVDFIDRIMKGFTSKSIEKNIRFEFYHLQKSLMLWFDPGKIEKIMYNLLSNAFKYTPSGGEIIVSIEIIEGELIEISVSDSGPGISPEDQEHIFERFYQAKALDHSHGTGIGLALSKSLAILHHGSLTVKSTPGKGANFYLNLPLGKDHLETNEFADISSDNLDQILYLNAGDEELNQHRDSIETIAVKKNVPLILLIEDNFRMRKYLEEVLVEDYNVISCDDGKKGFSIACEKLPDLIVSDVMMPEMDGIELTKKLRDEIITSHIPIILLTAKNEFDSFIEGISIGADDYIAKPFHVEHLLTRIKNLLENRRRLRKRYKGSMQENQSEFETQHNERDNEFISVLYEIAEKNIDNPDFTSDDFSKAVFMSRTNFYKKLKALTDQTPGEFLKLYRVKRAGEMLTTGEYSVSQVALMVGFKSRSHFYQCFKNFHGELPAEHINKKK